MPLDLHGRARKKSRQFAYLWQCCTQFVSLSQVPATSRFQGNISQTGWDLSGGTKSARTYVLQSETLTILGFFPSSLPSISHVPRAKPLWVIMICGMSRPSRQAKPGKSIDAQGPLQECMQGLSVTGRHYTASGKGVEDSGTHPMPPGESLCG